MTNPSASNQLRQRLALYSTLSRTITHFTPAEGDIVRMYVCGPTVYSAPHIGNMRTYLFADIVRRVLRFAGYSVRAAMNITDVGHLTSDADSGDDKMAKAAAAERATAWEVAEKYTNIFLSDAERLNILPMDLVLRATQHIPQQIALIQRLEEKGVVYRTDDGMYFDTSFVPDYGKLTPNDTREHLRAGERVAMGEKRHATDFSLWKFSAPDAPKRDMEWPSPWGVGFPGWHIECSAMAMEYLGETLDLHLGGIDHIPIHHTNEIAQSETATGVPFSRWWMHGAFLTLEGEQRMGKSEGNKITLDTLVDEGFDPLEFRYLALLSHYRSPLSFSPTALEQAANALRRLRHRVAGLKKAVGVEAALPDTPDSPYLKRFVDALADDLNMPRAVAELWQLVRDPEVDDASKLSLILAFDEVLGLDLESASEESTEIPDAVRQLAQERWELRSAKQFAESDKLRDEILAAGFTVQDGPEGYQLVPVND
ncbi:cysteine--tRNA ligase [Streptomyces alanosinicus]|uniref:Cysteine--tRNA ligase n=1 Tax=Streptomyces alanosinicus TaxID=68171 RepID=A0A919D4C6_9ACTN|nr:cysteine--tRNA ligase [Streptomyces alanosinicus]GHE07306.1 cysteine--tRNA ligase [Streptomyces alanosinicus]